MSEQEDRRSKSEDVSKRHRHTPKIHVPTIPRQFRVDYVVMTRFLDDYSDSPLPTESARESLIPENKHAVQIRSCDICMTKGDHVMMDCTYIA